MSKFVKIITKKVGAAFFDNDQSDKYGFCKPKCETLLIITRFRARNA